MDSEKPKKGRPPKNAPLAADGKSVKLLPDVDVQLGKAAKRLKMTKSDFASMAVAYFTDSGLDPRKMSKTSLAKIENRVVQETYDVREHNANIGNRLVGVIRTFERNMGILIQQQQAGTFKYLESIERNILSYLMAIEENLLDTMLERIMSNGIESHMTRIILQTVSLQLKSQKLTFSETDLRELTLDYDRQRDGQLVVAGRKLLEGKKIERPKLSSPPAFVELPKPPAKFTPPAPAIPAATTPGVAAPK